MNIFAFNDYLEIPQVVLNEQSDLLIEETPELIRDSQREISDAILEIVEETTLESRVEEIRDFSVEERLMYGALENENKGLDYSKLEYGKVAQPLAIKWDYSQYEEDDRKKGVRFVSEETISIEDVNKVISEKAALDKLRITANLVNSGTRDLFKYYQLLNDALIKIKYDLVFA